MTIKGRLVLQKDGNVCARVRMGVSNKDLSAAKKQQKTI